MDIKQQKKISIVYGVGQISTLVLELMAAYALFYMTTTKLMNATSASLIISACTIVATLVGLYVGYKADYAKKGKARLALTFLIPTMIAFCLFFAPVNFTGNAQLVYAAVTALLFYGFYYSFLTPFDALGGELVSDYNVRTFMRALCMVFLYVGVMFANTLSAFVRAWLMGTGMSDLSSWFVMAIIMAALATIAGLFACIATGKKNGRISENTEIAGASAEKTNIVKSYIETLKVKPVAVLTAWTVIYYIANMLLSPFVLYLGVYVIGLSQTTASTLYTVCIVATIVVSPFAAGIASKLGKKTTMILGSLVYLLFAVYALIKMPSTYMDGVLFTVSYSIVNVIAQSCSYSMLYDASEVAEFKTGKSKATETMGLYKCGMAIGCGLGSFILGKTLTISGFDGAALVQSAETVHGLVIGATVIPSVVLVVTVLIIGIAYKVNEKNHAALVKALEAKRKGEEYSTEGFEELL